MFLLLVHGITWFIGKLVFIGCNVMPVSSGPAESLRTRNTMDASKRYQVLAMLAAVALLVLPAFSKPVRESLRHEFQDQQNATRTQGCQQENEIEVLCQRCAKSTKSPMVYPMCCTNEEEVRFWCSRYLGFGRQ